MNVEQMRLEAKGILAQLEQTKSKHEQRGTTPTDGEIREAGRLIKRYEQIAQEVKELESIEGYRSAFPTVNRPLTFEDSNGSHSHRGGDGPFSSFGEQLVAVRAAGTPGGQLDPRLHEVRAVTGLGEGVPSDGGFLLQQDYASELLGSVFSTGVLSSRCRRIEISGNANSIKINGIDETSRVAGSRWGGIRSYWTAEAGEKVASKPTFRQITLELNKLIGLCYATDELIADHSALESVIRQGFASEIGFALDDVIINGSGAGQPLGILNAGCMISVTKESGQAADTIVYENIMKMWSRLLAPSRQTAVWLINQDCEPQLYAMSLAVGTGGVPVYLPAGGAAASPYGTLFGRPVLPIEQCQTLGDTGDIYLADFANGYILAEKGGMQTDVSIHVRSNQASLAGDCQMNTPQTRGNLSAQAYGNPEPSCHPWYEGVETRRGALSN